MSNCTLTLIGLYNYDNSIFDLMQMPKGIDKKLLINNILLKGGEFESLYTNPCFIKNAIDVWSNKWLRTFTKWIDLVNIEYNPIDNYDRHETWTDTTIGNVDRNGTNSANSSGNTKSNTTSDSNSTNKVSAYNDTEYSNRENDIIISAVNGDSNSINSSVGNNHDTEHSDSVIEHSAHIRGNIGIMSTQTLIRESLLLEKDWNIYEHITDIFLSEFVIPIY